MGTKRALDGFPGLLDGSDCSFDRGMCYVRCDPCDGVSTHVGRHEIFHGHV